MKICFIPAHPDKTAQSLLKTFAIFTAVSAEGLEPCFCPFPMFDAVIPTFSFYIGKLLDEIKIVHVKDFLSREWL